MSAYVNSILNFDDTLQKNAWLRRIKIKFTAKKPIDLSDVEADSYKHIVAVTGAVPKNSGVSVVLDSTAGDNLAIKVTGTKQIALTRDGGTIEIRNVSYETIATIIELQLYLVEIWVGYKDNDSLIKVAKGEVSYISQQIHSRHDSTLYITYASELVAAWSQNRINFSFRSGINAYDMLDYFFYKDGKSYANISESLKNVIYSEMYRDIGKTASVVDNLVANSNETLVLNSDSSFDDKVISVTDLSEKRVIKIDPSLINIGNGNPTITSQGLNVSLFPVMALCPGDILQFDKTGQAMFDLSQGMTTPESVYKTFNTNYIDPDGCYMIREISYIFENRGMNFMYKIAAISPKVYAGVIGAI